MNYFSTNSDLIKSVAHLLGDGHSRAERVNFGVSYSQNRRLSIVTVELSPTVNLHSLIYFYTRGQVLYDVLAVKNKRYIRVNQSGNEAEHVERINKLVMDDIPKRDPINARELREDEDSMLQLKDDQIQHLKDRLRIANETMRSLRNQIKTLNRN